jgi:hypothetical protein
MRAQREAPRRVWIPTGFLAVIAAATISLGAIVPSATAGQWFARTVTQMHQARLHGDWKTYRAHADSLVSFLNGSPDALLDLARADVNLSDGAGALDALRLIAAMGQAPAAVKTLPDFVALQDTSEFVDIAAQMVSNAAPVTRARLAFTVTDPRLVPEDIDYDAGQHRFFLTSILEDEIASVDASGHLAVFAHAPDHWPMLALKVDAKRHLVWATEVAVEGFWSVPKRAWGRSALVAYGLARGEVVRRIEGPPGTALGDMALGANGDLLISDGAGGGVYRLAAGASRLTLVNGTDFISPQTPAYAPDESLVFVPDYARGIGLLDQGGRLLRWIPMDERYALEGTDGLYYLDKLLVAVQNGTSPDRVVAFSLDASLDRVIGCTIVESGTPHLDPTHGVIVGDQFYYIANSGWDELDASGKVNAGATLTPARIMRAALPKQALPQQQGACD